MVVMGIDPGSQITGYGIVAISAGEAPRHVACGAIRTRSCDDFSARLKLIYDEVAQLIALHRPDQVALEDIFYARNARSSLLLGQARAAAVLAALNGGVPVSAYSPSEVKMAVTGRGSAAKEQVRYMVMQLLGITLSGESLDVSDALAIALCHALRGQSSMRRTRS
ncbi:MAG TPA: crossover junction endodeoxyribonuclease RuvC [bacterium]|nr:crossover junction endodeoxyribonuclease RuvC [bacterium]HOH08268.1 crossover junction endodeoxyribonuclease RuvC [bacterium]HOY45307.1 crossover junction endodeoxyribonuclease RuvC [bacterium]HPG83814.1 crossover junction endodeoxyribonuclease RuvC [bacterium]HPM60500.1 crossover junction endodeoxyribonuclease RuvC [bacterium]